eukprot:GHVL01043775.1.p1 GENE.GHVL01043775.1~~GHVL01043775.1.p1  ORF type:complete len:217 (-),score=28.92 GHVL01043775.1:119-769(-)
MYIFFQCVSDAKKIIDKVTAMREHLSMPQTSQTKSLALLLLVEFECRCICKPESLDSFVISSCAAPYVHSKLLEVMAAIAVKFNLNKVAVTCLKELLRFLRNSPKSDSQKIAMAYRELLQLVPARIDADPIFDEVLNTLSTKSDSLSDTFFPPLEIQWFMATCWNFATYYFHLQNYKFAEKWMSKSLKFSHYCQSLQHFVPQMNAAYQKCLKNAGH